MSRKVRLLYMEGVSPVRSQTVYHAVGYAMKEATPDTIILVSPNAPYVCIGYHQCSRLHIDMAAVQQMQPFSLVRTPDPDTAC